jgi:NADH-quinone oxidoreductase subunit L
MLTLLWLIPVLPLAGFVINGLLGRRLLPGTAVSWIACGAVAVSLLLSIGAVWDLSGDLGRWAGTPGLEVDVEARRVEQVAYAWIDIQGPGGLRVPWAYQLDPLSAVMLLVVNGVGFLIHVYSVGYMRGDPGYYRYFAYLNLFMAMMLVLVLGASLPVLFVGWEGVGLCSYLLIGFFFWEDYCADAGKKAFLVNRIGDFFFLTGMLLLFSAIGTLDTSELLRRAETGQIGAGLALVGSLLLFGGAIGKSAQIPLYVWLPDAMAGPTPVSALIHAATMVTAGVYLVVRMGGLFAVDPAALQLVAAVGILTACFAATIGLAQRDIKRVLAYSTVSQLGYMFTGAGVGAFAAAIFHLVTHAFFKALLFLGSGSVIHGMQGEQDMMKMGGLRARMPITYRTMLVGTLAIAGIVPLAGFFSKDEILWGALAGPLGRPWIWGLGVATAGLTAFYMFRLVYLTFFGKRRCEEKVWHHVHESPRVMTVPLVVLAVLSVCGGWIGIPRSIAEPLFGRDINWFEHWLHPALARVPGPEGAAAHAGLPGEHAGAPAGRAGGQAAAASAAATPGAAPAPHADPALEYGAMAASLAAAVGGIALAHLLYRRRRDLLEGIVRAAGPLYRLVYGKYFVDELYEAAILRPYWALCRLSRWFDTWVIDLAVNASRHVTIALSYLSTAWDKYVIDLLLVNGAGYVVRFLAWTSRRLQSGVVQAYATAIVFGVLLFVGVYFFFGLG